MAATKRTKPPTISVDVRKDEGPGTEHLGFRSTASAERWILAVVTERPQPPGTRLRILRKGPKGPEVVRLYVVDVDGLPWRADLDRKPWRRK